MTLAQDMYSGLERRQSRQTDGKQRWRNVGPNERLVSVASGVILAALGAARKGLPGLIVATVGGDLIFRGTLGYSPLYHALDIDTTEEASASPREHLIKRGFMWSRRS
jgi:uncharacterized membrane protein